VCTSSLDLAEHQPDFLVVSFYKIFGFPTGMAALLIKKSDRVKNSIIRKKCESRYFGGGTLQFALVDQDYVSVKQNEYKYHEYLENGTVSYLGVIGVALAIEKFEKLSPSNQFNSVMTQIQDYLKMLYSNLVLKLENLKHYNNEKLVELYRKCNDTNIEYGPIVAFNLKNSFGSYIGYALVDKLAQENRIHMRTGCFCNLGACKMFLNKNDDLIKSFKVHGHKCGDHIDIIDGKPTGAIRVSLGYSTIQTDIDMFLKFLRDYFIETKCTENVTASMDRKEENNISLVSQNSQQQYFKITSLYLYPIKSCAPMKIETSWPMTDQGLTYDRFWVIVDLNGIVLTQKRIPLLTHLRPFIDLKRNTLSLYFKNEKFELKLKNPSDNDELKRKQNIILNNMTNQVGCDEGDEIAEWLTRVFELKEPCRLVKSIVNNVFVNKAEYLLINEKSVASLRKYLIKSLNETEQHDKMLDKTIDEFLMLQFRANIIVNTELSSDQVSDETKFEEELWSRLKMLNKNIKFKVVENCTRCQMININQSNAILNEANVWSSGESQKYCSMLLKQLYKLKLNSKFGIYLSKESDNEEQIASTNEDISLESLVNKNLNENKTNQISIGDIGKAFKETK
jgi:molybdenum cofactor sulfurtransferase